MGAEDTCPQRQESRRHSAPPDAAVLKLCENEDTYQCHPMPLSMFQRHRGRVFIVPFLRSRHPYGNYVVQQLFEHGNNEQRACAVQKLVKNASCQILRRTVQSEDLNPERFLALLFLCELCVVTTGLSLKVVLVASDCNGGAVLLKAMMNTSKQEQTGSGEERSQ